jgi:protein-S-isoprenylcysteine O-methyltransferase Ste14
VMIRYLIQFLWLALLLFWLVTGVRIKPAKQMERGGSRLTRMALTIFVFVFLLSHWGRIGWLAERFVPHSEAIAMLGALLTALGVGLAGWARYRLGTNWSSAVALKKGHELICAGPYARIRHPIYSGVLLGLLGTALAIGEWRGLVAFGVVFTSYFIKARKEEALLAREFGPAFDNHSSRTGMFLPRLD